MSSDSPKPLVLIIGATGLTGESIAQGLLDSGNFVGASTYCSTLTLLTFRSELQL